ncbi:mitochondrial intermembrane space import and assembly protein 40 homolog isoform X2 [Prunus persica]|uniref:mitochondrial intermembrane space import and assembly protein 40 homolog isoform X2 n=1 Tax=Prunus persica TaxID=3760 RepID=UPI0009AB1F19|nr:mitochondrial intermembrane space import and assembly protein 40 homolog isoform X2 [Prunus persica]
MTLLTGRLLLIVVAETEKMGQVQSEAATVDQQGHWGSSAVPSASPSFSSMDSLIAGVELCILQSLDAKAQKALECPCIANLRSGPCGHQFAEAFVCYLKSTVEEKGSDCVHPFVVLQKCIKANPHAFSKDVLKEDEVKKEEKLTQDYKIIPPKWSRESPSPKSKL